MDGLGDQLLAGAAFAADEHGSVGGGDSLEPIDDRLHLARGVDDALEAEPLVEPPAQLQILLLEANRVGRFFANKRTTGLFIRLPANSRR